MINPAVASMEASAGATDPGAVDNRLTLDPGDARWSKMLAGWKDGERYPITIGGVAFEMSQMSPGEFEIVGGEAAAAEPEEEEVNPTPRYGKVNRAVMSMDEA